MIKVEEARIKIKGESSPFHPLPPTRLKNMFVRMEDLNEEIHINQTGAFPHTSQHGNCYIMVAVHLNANCWNKGADIVQIVDVHSLVNTPLL